MPKYARLAIAALLLLAVSSYLWPTPAYADGWVVPQNLSQHSSDVQQASIAVDSNGQIHVVWSDGTDLFHRVKTAGQWSASQRIASGTFPDLAADNAGHVYLVFVNRFGAEKEEVYFISWQQAMGWSLPSSISNTPTASIFPRIAVGSGDYIAIVWSEESGDSFSIYVAQSRAGSVWSIMPIPNARGTHPVIVISSLGDLLVAWQDVLITGYPMEIFFSRYNNGAWSPEAIDASVSPLNDSIRASLAENKRRVCLAWQESTVEGEAIYTSSSTGDSWSAPQKASGSAAALAPWLAFDAWDNGHLAWTTGNAIQYRLGAPNAVLQPFIENVATDLIDADAPKIASEEGVVHIIWLAQSPSAYRDVWYSMKTLSRLFLPLLTKGAHPPQ